VQRHHLADDALLFDLGDASPATTARACALAAANRPLLLRFDPFSEAADVLPALIERLTATM